MVQRFESVATGVVTAHGGRVVKTVGDEVFFASRTAAPAAAIALDLIDALAEDSMLPAVRVGVSYGSVVSRLGDLFGTTVNRAARLTPMAHPGSVLVDDFLADALRHHPGFTLTPMRRRRLRGPRRLGLTVPALVGPRQSAASYRAASSRLTSSCSCCAAAPSA